MTAEIKKLIFSQHKIAALVDCRTYDWPERFGLVHDRSLILFQLVLSCTKPAQVFWYCGFCYGSAPPA